MRQLYELEMIGGPWERRLASRRADFDGLPWHEAAEHGTRAAIDAARWVWTQSSFSEYASAASFAEIATALLAAKAPIDLIAAAGDFVVDEMLHAELSARVAVALGGAMPLEVDLERLVRPPEAGEPLLRAAELIVRTSCVGEALTIPVLKSAAAHAQVPLIELVIARILRDESSHAEIGGWFLDWAEPMLSDADRTYLGGVATRAVASFAPLFADPGCPGDITSSHGTLACDAFDEAFERALCKRVIEPLALRGIEVKRSAPRTPSGDKFGETC